MPALCLQIFQVHQQLLSERMDSPGSGDGVRVAVAIVAELHGGLAWQVPDLLYALQMSVPLHVTEAGLPVGCQLGAAPGKDALLLELAYQLEEAAPWASRWPSFAGAT